MIPSILYLTFFVSHQVQTSYTLTTNMLLLFSGLVTVLPLITFNYAAKQLPLTIFGFLQYLGAIISFLTAIFYYGESFTITHKVAFSGIWMALLIVSW